MLEAEALEESETLSVFEAAFSSGADVMHVGRRIPQSVFDQRLEEEDDFGQIESVAQQFDDLDEKQQGVHV